jgi:hypothetical protein
MIFRTTRNEHAAIAGRAGRLLACLPLTAAVVLTGLAAGAQASTATAQPQSVLDGVSCTSPSACIAVGVRAGHNAQDRTIAEAWNGQAWSLQSPVNPRTNRPDNFSSISCASPTLCFAAGSIGSFNNASHQTLIEMWNGTAWSVQVLGSPKNAQNQFFSSVSCGGPSSCVAVGDEHDNTGQMPLGLSEHWDGTTWSAVPTAVPAGASVTSMFGVSCGSPDSCTAVGQVGDPDGGGGTLAEHFDGQKWTIEPTPAFPPSAQPQLLAVSCSGTDCMAVGRKLSGNGFAPIAESFNGHSWSLVSLATPAGSVAFTLGAISCASPASCYAVGASGTQSAPGSTLTEQWNGHSWAVVASPSAAGLDNLNGVSCTSSQSCVAVGAASTGTTQSTLAMRLSGGHWAITPTPSPG